MKTSSRNALGATAVVAGLLVLQLAATGCETLECGDGTVEVDGYCVATEAFLKCAPGFLASGTECIPEDEWIAEYCDYPDKRGTAVVFNGRCIGVGSTSECTQQCQAGEEVCIQGRVFDLPSLVASGDERLATPIVQGEGAQINVYNPLDQIADPYGAQPLASSQLDENGCFIVRNLTVPITNFFNVALQDVSSSTEIWANVATAVDGVAGQNIVNLTAVGLKKELSEKWGADWQQVGHMLAWYRNAATGQGEAGVTPTTEGAPPPWTDMPLFFFDADISNEPYLDPSTDVTTASGMISIRKALPQNFGGTKEGCTITPKVGGAAENGLLFRIIPVEGC